MPKRFKTAAQVARFKRAQRYFDQVLLDLDISSPQDVKQRNSVIPSHQLVGSLVRYGDKLCRGIFRK